ncbi:hypothetical protein Moror_11079 [Moniliophthora roreri MCA 2997]|uniref:Uncharacterized protein n=1 Tax=Moniliophthora roreri (strain MCA 2997) TaxID=1381753 RepID=V2WRP4_MONRO|nr:hypothetical protein Moror_11079 [Moniliophthora roreri MCA 2997]
MKRSAAIHHQRSGRHMSCCIVSVCRDAFDPRIDTLINSGIDFCSQIHCSYEADEASFALHEDTESSGRSIRPVSVIENAVRLYKDEGIRRNAICPRRMDTKAVLANGLLGWEKVQTLL